MDRVETLRVSFKSVVNVIDVKVEAIRQDEADELLPEQGEPPSQNTFPSDTAMTKSTAGAQRRVDQARR